MNRFVKDKEKNVVATDVDDRVVDFLSWFDMKTAAAALDEFSFCVSDRVRYVCDVYILRVYS